MTLEEIKRMRTMAEVTGDYGLRPNRAGFIHCPFHQDKGASMKVYRYDAHCFGCGWHGDAIDFVAKYNGLSFKEAFQMLGGTYEVNEDTKRKIREAEKQRLAKQEAELLLQEQKRKNNNYISLLRKGADCFPAFTEEWCFCQNELPKQLHIHEELSNTEVMRWATRLDH